MTNETTDLPSALQQALDRLELSASPVDAPPGESTSSLTWFELYSKFATRGFVRALAGVDGERTSLRVQFAIPSPSADFDIPDAVRDASTDLVGGDWAVVTRDPDWNVGVTLDRAPDSDVCEQWLERALDLGDAADSGDVAAADWLRPAGETSAAEGGGSKEETGSKSRARDPERAPVSGDPSEQVFEPIGDESADGAPSRALESVGVESWELMEADGGSIEARIRLDGTLPPDDRERLGRELAHNLRSRYDIAARPVPAETGAPSTAAELRLRAEPADSGLDAPASPDEVRGDLEGYMERIVRFDELGVTIASVLGLHSDSSSNRTGPITADPDRRQRDARDRKRGRGRREASSPAESSQSGEATGGGRDSGDSASRDDSSRRSRPSRREGEDEAAVDEADDKVVLDLGSGGRDVAPSSSASPESGLEPGNYRDPRLMREDATTSLVDIVLRHPGYAEEKMGHNLSILLSIDYPDAMELVHQAPSVIAWGVGRKRALDFKRFIEDAGGKVVLIEPDSLTG